MLSAHARKKMRGELRPECESLGMAARLDGVRTPSDKVFLVKVLIKCLKLIAVRKSLLSCIILFHGKKDRRWALPRRPQPKMAVKK